MFSQFILADDAIPMRHEVREDVEDLGPKWAGFPAAAELVQSGVQFIIAKDIDHSPLLAPRRERITPIPDATP
jgi:hypothetical protein